MAAQESRAGESSRAAIRGAPLAQEPCADGIAVHLSADKAYEGRLCFDVPRHRLYMGFAQDWPRMNAVPEWFTVEPDETHHYTVADVDAATERRVTGKLLSEGLPVRLPPGKPLRLIVRPAKEAR